MGMSTGGGGNGRAPLSEINVTPLVDVMLVLLVVFMVTAPLLATGLRVELPEVKATEAPYTCLRRDARTAEGLPGVGAFVDPWAS